MPPDPEIEDVIGGAPIADPNAAAKEVGGTINEEGKFETDFGSVIDDIRSGLKPLTQEEPETSAAVQTGATGPTGPVTAPETTASGPTGVTGPVQTRDSDIDELAGKLDLKTKPKTKEIIDGFKGKVTQERNQREQIAKERDELKKQLDDLSKRPVPKGVSEELEQLRQTVQELDAARDPTLQAKYDKKITANEDRVVAILKENGFGLDKEGKEVPGVVDALRKSGLTRKNLESKIADLAKAGEHESAEELRDLLRENSRLGKEKGDEIEKFKASAGDRKKANEVEIQKQVESANKRLTEEVTAYVGKFDFLKEPPAPKPEDAPAVKQEKEKAIAAFNEKVSRLSEITRKETATPVDVNISARLGIIAREQVIPQLQSDLATARKQIEELTNQMKALRGAGNLGNKGAGLVQTKSTKEDPSPHENYEDAVDSMARQAGLIK